MKNTGYTNGRSIKPVLRITLMLDCADLKLALFGNMYVIGASDLMAEGSFTTDDNVCSDS